MALFVVNSKRLLVPHLRLNAFKYPLAFIRLFQLLFVVIALSSVNSWNFTLSYKCAEGQSAKKLDTTTLALDSLKLETCDGTEATTLWPAGEGYSAGFFYFVNALALVSLLLGLFFYVVLWDFYQSEGRARLADLGLTALCFILFFFCTSIWWSACNGVGHSTSQEYVTSLLTHSPHFWNGTTLSESALTVSPHTSVLTISVLAGWVSVVLFAAGCWYIWKEIAPTPANNPTSIA